MTFTITTKQQALDIAVSKIREQGKPSYEVHCGECNQYGRECGCGAKRKPSVSCRYRGGNGCSCAIGALIRDAEHDSGMEGLPATSVSVIEALQNSGVDVGAIGDDFLVALQECHDNWAEYSDFMERFEEAVYALCVNEGLIYPEPTP